MTRRRRGDGSIRERELLERVVGELREDAQPACTCNKSPVVGPKTCDGCGSATTQITGGGGFRVVCLTCNPEWLVLVEHDVACPRGRG